MYNWKSILFITTIFSITNLEWGPSPWSVTPWANFCIEKVFAIFLLTITGGVDGVCAELLLLVIGRHGGYPLALNLKYYAVYVMLYNLSLMIWLCTGCNNSSVTQSTDQLWSTVLYSCTGRQCTHHCRPSHHNRQSSHITVKETQLSMKVFEIKVDLVEPNQSAHRVKNFWTICQNSNLSFWTFFVRHFCEGSPKKKWFLPYKNAWHRPQEISDLRTFLSWPIRAQGFVMWPNESAVFDYGKTLLDSIISILDHR